MVFIQKWAPYTTKIKISMHKCQNEALEITKIRSLFAQMGPMSYKNKLFYTEMGPLGYKNKDFSAQMP